MCKLLKTHQFRYTTGNLDTKTQDKFKCFDRKLKKKNDWERVFLISIQKKHNLEPYGQSFF